MIWDIFAMSGVFTEMLSLHLYGRNLKKKKRSGRGGRSLIEFCSSLKPYKSKPGKYHRRYLVQTPSQLKIWLFSFHLHTRKHQLWQVHCFLGIPVHFSGCNVQENINPYVSDKATSFSRLFLISSVLVLFCKLSALRNLNLTAPLKLSPSNIPFPNPSLSSFQIKLPSSTYSANCPQKCLVKYKTQKGRIPQACLFSPL